MSASSTQLQTTDGQVEGSGGDGHEREKEVAADATTASSDEENSDDEEASEDDDDENEDGSEESSDEGGRETHEYDIPRAAAAAALDSMGATRWAFVAPFLLKWVDHSSCAPARLPESNSFGSFTVYRVGGVMEPVRTRYIIQLVASMLHVDPEAWRFLRVSERPWFRSFDPTAYDQATLIPKMTFMPRGLISRTGDDTLGGVRELHELLLAKEAKRSNGLQDIKKALRELPKLDTTKKLRDFALPIRLSFSPEEPRTRDALQLYLRTVVALVEALQQQRPASSCEYPFRLEGIQLTLYHLHLDAVQPELFSLLSFGVPVNIHIRHLVRSFRDPFMCKESGHVYAALAENPSPVSARAFVADGAVHKLEQSNIYSSCELWSAVAYAPSLSGLAAFYMYVEDPAARRNQVKWLSFALRNGSLRSLVLYDFEPQLDDMAAFREIAESPDPVRQLAASPSLPSGTEKGPQVVRLKPNAVMKIASGASKSQRDLGIEKDWRLPVVAIHSEEKRIEFIVPGYAVCSTSMSKVASIDVVAPVPSVKDRGDTGLRSLQIASSYQAQPGLAARFVETYGQSLRQLRWDGNEHSNFDDDVPFDEDLEAVLSSCPHLESLELQYRRLYSLQTLVRHFESPAFYLRKLTLKHAAVPPQELVQFFTHLANPRNRLAKTLESLEFESYFDSDAKPFVSLDEAFCCVDVAVIDAALSMLRTNRTLSYFSLGISRKLWDAHRRRFDAEKGVRVKSSKRLPLRERLAFVSVAQSQGDTSEHAIQQLDSACMAAIFDFFTHTTVRQVVVKEMD